MKLYLDWFLLLACITQAGSDIFFFHNNTVYLINNDTQYNNISLGP